MEKRGNTLLVAALALSVALPGCTSKAAIFQAACDARDADACEIMAARLLLGTDGPADPLGSSKLGARAWELRTKACAEGNPSACEKLNAGRRVWTPVDAPRPAPPPGVEAGVETVQMLLAVDIHADERTDLDGVRVDDDALLAQAREAVSRFPDTRAVIRADGRVAHGRVIRVLDLLKQAGVTKIAFGVAPVAVDAGAP
jgi:biopolymer transport protein ExbD